VQTKIKMKEDGIFEVTSSRQCKFVIAKPEMEGTLHPCTLGGRSSLPAVQYATINTRSSFDKILSKKYAAFRNVMTQQSLYERSRAHMTTVSTITTSKIKHTAFCANRAIDYPNHLLVPLLGTILSFVYELHLQCLCRNTLSDTRKVWLHMEVNQGGKINGTSGKTATCL